MKKIILLLAIIVIAQTLYCQEKLSDDNIQIGVPYPVVDAHNKRYFAYKDLILGVKSTRKKRVATYTLQTYSANKLTLEKVRIYDDFPEGFYEEAILQLKGKIFLFYSTWDNLRKKDQLYVREIDVENTSFKGKGKLIFNLDYKISGLPSGMWGSGKVVDKFDFHTSFDETKLIIKYRKKPLIRNDKKNTAAFGFKLFNENVELLHKMEITMPYTENRMHILDYSVDNKGAFYIATYVYPEKTKAKVAVEKEAGAKKSKNSVHVLKFSARNHTKSDKEIPQHDGKTIRGLRLFEAGDGNLVAMGYYSSGGKKGNNFYAMNGVFKFDIGDWKKEFQVNYYDIPLALINQNRRKRAVKKSKKKEEKIDGGVGMTNLDPEVFYLHEDGSVVLIGEQYYVTTTTTTDANGRTSTRKTYHYDDVLITKINKDGTLAYMKKMAKRQTNNLSSFKLLEGKNDLYLIFRDNIENLNLNLIDVPRKATIDFIAYKMNYETGESKRISLFNRVIKKLKTYQFKLHRIVSTSADEFVFEVYKKKKEDVLIKVELK